ncbi:MAG: PDZ domain-containing protein [Bacteroidales bacterium]|nr:PDZ domain-containing protein [Bacteroidales bacterium]
MTNRCVMPVAVLAWFWVNGAHTLFAADINAATEQAMKSAARVAAPWVVKIETSGGSEFIPGPGGGRGGPGIRKGVGPTTGLVVAADGYIITSAFNFANKPTDIFASVPGHPRMVAKIIANDTTRMLTLLKVDLQGLATPTAFPKKEMRVGQWSLALGRAIDPDIADVPSISIGIISALGRIWGKAVQTDAKVSPTNYGGPLISVDGRVFGVLVPASPQGDGETAGVEWYDSGIGFAIPLEDVLAVLPRLKNGQTLQRGLLGITPQQAEDKYNLPIVVGTVAVDSVAEKAGIKPGDTIVSLDGKPMPHFSALQHHLGPKYDGDRVAIVVERDGKRIDIGTVTLSGIVKAYEAPFLGILPMRDDTETGVEVRYVYPNSAAERAKIVAGDRILKIGPPGALPGVPAGAGAATMQPVKDREQLIAIISKIGVGGSAKLELKRSDGKSETVTVKLTGPTDAIAAAVPLPSSRKKSPAPKVEPGKEKAPEPKPNAAESDQKFGTVVTKTHGALGREYWVYAPPSYDKATAHGVIVWLHTTGKGGKDARDMADFWGDFCDRHHFILVGPKSRNDSWVASEAEEIVQLLNDVFSQYTIDRRRVIAHGMGVGGQMAYYLGFHARDLIRGVATSGAALGNSPKDTVPNQPLAFFIVAGDKDPNLPAIMDGKAKLQEKKYPVIFRTIKDFGKEYLTLTVMEELQRWMDSLDKI